MSVPTLLYTTLALVAFAANSVLCRAALLNTSIDAGSFTVIRLLAGAFTLGIILAVSKSKAQSKGSWAGASMLFLYAVCFSFAYIQLDTGTGALILFTTVQLTIFAVLLLRKAKISKLEWIGAFGALGGFVYLFAPGEIKLSWLGGGIMSIAGLAWAGYTLIGKGSQHALADTTYNFLRCAPFALILAVINYPNIALESSGVIFAILSGALASGIGYALWYAALRGLPQTLAALSQLIVPILASFGGILFNGDQLSAKFVFATALILAGLAATSHGAIRHKA